MNNAYFFEVIKVVKQDFKQFRPDEKQKRPESIPYDMPAGVPSAADPLGSYTGLPMDPNDKLVQDADDL